MPFEFTDGNEPHQSKDSDVNLNNNQLNPGSIYNNKNNNISSSPKSKAKATFHHHTHHHHHQIQPKLRSKSLSYEKSSSSPSPLHQHSPQLQQQLQQLQRRPSSFSSTSSPWFRRKSFLSSSMMSNDKSSVYELSSYSYDQRLPNFTMSLKESQGFIFNQDLFASQYQQSRVILQDDNQGVILKDLRSEHSMHDNREEGEDYGIETTDVFIDSDESDDQDVLAL